MRATTSGTPKRSRATRAATMLLLSPLVAATKASARSMPALISVSRSNTSPVSRMPVDALELLEDLGAAVDDRDRVALGLELVREVAADSAVPSDDDVHVRTPSSGAARRPITSGAR